MNQCEARTSRGPRCRRLVKKGQRFCSHHSGADAVRVGAVAIGAILGNAMLPGAGAILGGGLAWSADHARLSTRRKRRVFLSFDYEHDRKMKTMFAGQCANPEVPFEIVDCSLQEAAPEDDWIAHATEAIAASELVVVLVGRYTWRARGVLAEVRVARALGVPTAQVWAYKNQRGSLVKGAGRAYPWRWDKLSQLLE